jgi:hypothetical protein
MLVVALALGLAVALVTADTPSVGSWIRLSLGAVLLSCGLFLMSPFATKRPLDPQQAGERRRFTVYGSAVAMEGLAFLVPEGVPNIALTLVAVLLLASAVMGRPKRVFAPRP